MDGNTTPGSSLFPLHRCKILHLVRHGQGSHNVDGEKDPKAFLSPEHVDATLTPLGWKQVDDLRKHVHECGLAKKIDLVITSPLTRAMQTAVGVFGGDSLIEGPSVPPLMVENAGNSGRLAISSLDCPPVIAMDHCRGVLAVQPCDKRRSISESRLLFPAIDFSLIENNEDVLWKVDAKEENSEEVVARGLNFFDWLWTRKEKEIAIVSHTGFLLNTLRQFGNCCHPMIKNEISKYFTNCELRSMVLVDRSAISSDPPTSNYSKNIPDGPDFGSDVAPEQQPQKKCTAN